MAAGEPEGSEGEKAVEHKQFVAQGVVQVVCAEPLDAGAEQWRGHGDERNVPVIDRPAGEKAECKQTQQRAVGISGYHIDGIKQTGAVRGSEHQHNGKH